MPSRRRRLAPAAARHLAALGLYTAAALLLTWPLVTRLASHVPGDGIDDPSLAWNLWWLKAQLVDQLNIHIFDVGWMFHPVRINLAFYTLTPLNGLQSVPLQTALSLVLANNFILLSTFVLGAYGMFLLGLHIQGKLGDPPAAGRVDLLGAAPALLAGLIYAFASAKLFYAALGQFNIASSHWLPFAALYILRLGESRSPRRAAANGALAGLFMVLQAWSELTYASFLLVFWALYCLWWIAVRTTTSQAGHADTAAPPASYRAFALGLVIAALVFLAGLAPFLAAMLPDMLAEGDIFAGGGGFADVFSADLMGYFAPTRLHPIFGPWTAGLPFPNDKGQHIYLGYSLLLLALGGLRYRRRLPATARPLACFWLLAAVLFWALTLGPHLRWAGHDLPISGPFALISRLPFFSGNRYPSRYSVMLLLAAAALSVYALHLLLHGLTAARARTAQPAGRLAAYVALAIAALFVFEHLSAPLPLNDLRVPAVYQRIAADPDDFAVLELPTGWRNGARVLGKSDVLIMMQQWYQTAHGKPRLGGNTSRNPAYKFQYFTDAPLIGDLIALMNADREHIAAVAGPSFAELVARNRPLAPRVLAFLGVKYVVVHVDKSPKLLLRFVQEALPVELIDTWRGPDWSGAPAEIRLYQVRADAAPAAWQAHLSSHTGRLYLGSGWSALEAPDDPLRYATRPVSQLLLDVPDRGGRLQLELAKSAATPPGLTMNGSDLAAPALRVDDAGRTWADIAIPPGVAGELVDTLNLTWRDDPLSLSALEPGAALSVRSAGEEVGSFAHIYVNGIDVAPNTRGYNLAALTPAGDLLAAAVFDTHATPQASHDLAAWLQQWPAGTVIAGAVADEASFSLQAQAVDALQQLGVQTDLHGRFRWSHAFIGATGAPPASAAEQANLLAPAAVLIGPPVDAAQVYGAAGELRFSPAD